MAARGGGVDGLGEEASCDVTEAGMSALARDWAWGPLKRGSGAGPAAGRVCPGVSSKEMRLL
jgi:hypothetical protein